MKFNNLLLNSIRFSFKTQQNKHFEHFIQTIRAIKFFSKQYSIYIVKTITKEFPSMESKLLFKTYFMWVLWSKVIKMYQVGSHLVQLSKTSRMIPHV